MRFARAMIDQAWYYGFVVFCEVKHPLTRPLKILQRASRAGVSGRPPFELTNAHRGPVPKKIWTFWAQGWEAAPPLVQVCRDSWVAQNPGWEVISLTAEDVPKYVTFNYPLEGKRLTHTNYSNLLRLSILAKEGGVWVDGTTFCGSPLDTWLPLLAWNGFFVFSKPKTTVADWIVVATKGHPLIRRWEEYEYRYWKFATSEWRYFWPHYLFEYLIFNNAYCRGVWHNTPRVSSDGPYAAQRQFKADGSEETLIDNLFGSHAPIHKLDWRMKVSHQLVDALRLRLNKSHRDGMLHEQA
ncbi:MAG: capsular polysaccharide synthesis protein [Candidatus Paceibacterota bacterium]